MKWSMTIRTATAIMTGVAVGVLAWMLPPIPRKTIELGLSEDKPFNIRTISSDGRFALGESFSDQQIDGFVVVWDLEDTSTPLLASIPPDGTQLAANEFSPDGQSLLCVSLGIKVIHFRVFDFSTGRVKSEGELDNNGQGFPFFAENGRLINRNQEWLIDTTSGEKIAEIPDSDAEFSWAYACDPYSMYRKNQLWRVYSRRTGEFVAEAELPSNDWDATVASEDGRVLICFLNKAGIQSSCKLIDTRCGLARSHDCLGTEFKWNLAARFCVSSPTAQFALRRPSPE
jgi:WD40 repeat protein